MGKNGNCGYTGNLSVTAEGEKCEWRRHEKFMCYRENVKVIMTEIMKNAWSTRKSEKMNYGDLENF